MRRLNEEYFWFGLWYFQVPNAIGLVVELLGGRYYEKSKEKVQVTDLTSNVIVFSAIIV